MPPLPLPAHVPASGPVVPTAEAASRGRFEQQAKEVVSVRVTDRGFVVGGAGDVDPLLPCKGGCTPESYDYAGLRQAMQSAKLLHPTEQRVVIAPEGPVPFEVIVKVMDATRDMAGDGGKRVPLFPQPLLASPPPKKAGGGEAP